MSRFSLIAAVALVAAVAVANTEISLELDGKLNLTSAASDFAFRWSSAGLVDGSDFNAACKLLSLGQCDLPVKFYTWSSSSVKAESADKYKGTLDGMIAAAFPPSKYVFPFAIMAYGTGKQSLSVDMSKWLLGILSQQGSGSFQGGAVAMAALSLEEYTPDGEYVDDSLVLINGDDCSPKELDGLLTEGMSCVVSLNNANKDNDCKATVTYVTSKVAGILKYGKTPVSPRSIDMIIEVENFKLHDSKNHVRMNLALVTASGDIDYDGNSKIIVKDGEKVYVAASGHVMVGDKRAEVDVKVESGSLPENIKQTFEAVAKVALGADLDVSIVHVDFPQGATSFIYDPAAGSGTNVYKAGASTLSLSLLALLLCSLLFLF